MTPGEARSAEQSLVLADQALRSARLLLSEKVLEDAASRLYYAAFHAATAALTIRGLHAKTHTGLVHMYQQTFGSAPAFGRALDLRIRADYGKSPLDITPEELERLMDDIATFVELCRATVTEAIGFGPDEPDPEPDL